MLCVLNTKADSEVFYKTLSSLPLSSCLRETFKRCYKCYLEGGQEGGKVVLLRTSSILGDINIRTHGFLYYSLLRIELSLLFPNDIFRGWAWGQACVWFSLGSGDTSWLTYRRAS